MSAKDTVTKEYTKDARIFADAFNQLIYKGEQVIQPERLHPVDTTAVVLPRSLDGTVTPLQRVRDGMKVLTAMEDDAAIYLMLGLENQSEVHYAMPVRNLLYDAMQYAEQVREIASEHRRKEAASKVNAGEFLSGFYRSDRLVPVITLVLHFGAEKWDGPVSLHEMLTVQNPHILSFVTDYKLNLLSPATMTEEELNRFTTSLREVMLFMKYSKDKAKLNEMLQNDAGFRKLDRQAATVIRTVTGFEFEIEKEKEKEDVNMCQAIQEIIEDAKAEGHAEGHAEGMRFGEQETKRETAVRMLAKGYDASEIVELIGLSDEEIDLLRVSLLQKSTAV